MCFFNKSILCRLLELVNMFDIHGHGESIYNIIPPKEVQQEKPPMHRSTHNGQIPPTASTFGHAQTSHPVVTNLAGDANDKVVQERKARTMGKQPGALKPEPRDFTKKGMQATQVKTLAEATMAISRAHYVMNFWRGAQG
jgi:hypothetical protein